MRMTIKLRKSQTSVDRSQIEIKTKTTNYVFEKKKTTYLMLLALKT